jgi:lysophospholipase L1-like esterase
MRTVKRWFVSGGIAVSVVAALAVAFLVGMVLGAGGIAVGRTGGASSPAPLGAPSPVPSAGETAAVTTVVEERPVALFIGDSYTVGQRSSALDKRWSTIVAREMGWTERNAANNGTGFVSRRPDMDRLSYAEQLRSVRPGDVDIVVIAGGQNDFSDLREAPAEVFSAIASTYDLAARRFPDAEIIAVGPSTPWEIGLEARALDGAVRAAADRHGATYVSLLDPDVVRDQYIDGDRVHVNDEGYAAIARRVVAQIS